MLFYDSFTAVECY